MSDPRDDDEPVSIEADAPEADWIEQHQPVIDEDDADAVHERGPRSRRGISIESDTPEADWIEQHQPIVEAPDEERLPSTTYPGGRGRGELEQDWITTDEDVGVADDQEIPTAPPSDRGGCNVLAAITHAVLRRVRRRPTTRESHRRPPG